jgi:curved DNA-binding protein
VPERDLYDILGVARTATPDDIKKAYRQLAKKYHPDVNPGDKAAEEKFKEVTAAADVLNDPKRRALYDEFGADSLRSGFDAAKADAYRQWKRQGAPQGRGMPDFGNFREVNVGDFGTFDFGSLFEDLFGRQDGAGAGRGQRRGAAAPQGSDVEAELEVVLRDAVLGAEREIRLDGRTLRVKIPKGVVDGSTIRLAGQGAPSPRGGPAGDLYLKVKLAQHPWVKREGKDLYLELPVTVPEALLGGEVTLPTFEGPVRLSIPVHTQSGKKLRLRGKGMPDLRGGERGDLYAVVSIVLPERTAGLEKVAKTMAEHYKGDPRAAISL